MTPRRIHFVALAVAAALAAVATNALIGQTTERRPSGLVTVRSRPGEVPPVAQHPANTLRTAKLARLDVSAAGRKVAVSGSAEVLETVPGNRYVWLLRIYTGGNPKNLLKEHHYLDQAVTSAPGEVAMTPAFDDAIELPPGTYKVELSLYGVPQDFPFDKVAFGADMRKKAIIKVSAFHKITVAD